MKTQPGGNTPKKQEKTGTAPLINKELSVVFYIDNFADNKSFVSEILSRVKPENVSKLDIVLASAKAISETQLAEFTNQNSTFKIREHQLSEAFEANYSYGIVLSCSMDVKVNINEILAVKGLEPEMCSKIRFSGGGKTRLSKQGIWVLTREAISYVVGAHIEMNSVDYFIRKQGFKTNEITVNHSNPFKKLSCVEKVKKSFFNFLQWYLIQPIKETTGKINYIPAYRQNRESSIYRLLFFIIAFGLMFAMPILSLDAGMSGDEIVNYDHAKLVYDYYAKGDKSSVDINVNPNLEKTTLQYYGQSFDNITYIVNKITGTDNPYESRHVMNSLVGWLIILVAGLFLSHIMGWRAAIFGMLFLFVSPRFLGHSYNNPKDIPFAFAYLFTIFQAVLFIREMPKTNIKRLIYISLGIAMAISVRVGGLMLIAYLMLFVGVAYVFSFSSKEYFSSKFWNGGFRLIGILGIFCIVGFYIGLILWPYAIEAPIKHSKESLDLMTNYSVGIRQLFEGNNIWSDRAPWYYLPKYIFMTIPILVIIGVAFTAIFAKPVIKKIKGTILFILVFACAFPVLYIIYKKSNVYGGWRHVLFIYPFLVMLAAVGFETGLRMLKNKYARIVGLIVIGFLVFLPLKHIAKNHPHEYVYYNEFAGGVEKAYGHYEMDYYYHSMRAATNWLIDYIKKNPQPNGQKALVATNNLGITNYYIRHDTNIIQPAYVRYYERGSSPWDYYIVVNSYIDAKQLQTGIWPPKNTIHTIDVDGKPVCAIVKRIDKDDYLASEFKTKSENPKDSMNVRIANMMKAEELFKKSLQADPNNELSLLSLTEMYMNRNSLDTANQYADMLLKVYPTYESGLNMKGWIGIQLFDKNKNPKALEESRVAFEKITKVNYKFVYGYYGLAMVYVRMNDINKAISVLEEALKINPGFQQAAEMLNQLKNYSAQQGGM